MIETPIFDQLTAEVADGTMEPEETIDLDPADPLGVDSVLDRG
ncbi:MAG: hypothetical protein ACREX8_02950 [Gammaproteobacteria bacterium]